MERKIPPLACLLDCLSAHHASPCIFSSCLTFLLKKFIDFILFFPLAFYFHYLLVLCLRMACDVMNMLFLDFFLAFFLSLVLFICTPVFSRYLHTFGMDAVDMDCLNAFHR